MTTDAEIEALHPQPRQLNKHPSFPWLSCIGIAEKPELERMKRQRQIDAWRKSKIHLNKPRVKVVGD